MVRYYYDDPLAAAWMAKHFGMKFITEHSWSIVADIEYEYEGPQGPYYIHPDSLHLLEPQMGDMILVGALGVDVLSAATVQRADGILMIDDGGWYRVSSKNTVIQRKNLPFHWPKTAA